MKHLPLILILFFSSSLTYSQGCGLISGKKDNRGAVVSSKDFYSLLIRKNYNTTDSLNYSLFLNVASRQMLTDSLLSSKGVFELYLSNGDKIEIDNASCENDPLKMGNTIAFTVNTTEEVMVKLVDNPIEKLTVFGLVETEFSLKNQKKQIKIITCLKNNG
jgi:hypothetical protein